jgi:hypothetical protein
MGLFSKLFGKEPDYSDPVVEMEWCDEQEENIMRYLKAESVSVAGEPEIVWALPPYVSLWTLTADGTQETMWVISGDLPTDRITDSGLADARAAAGAFGRRWSEVAEYMLQGKTHPSIQIGNPDDPGSLTELGDLLQRRAALLQKWAKDDSVWEDM